MELPLQYPTLQLRLVLPSFTAGELVRIKGIHVYLGQRVAARQLHHSLAIAFAEGDLVDFLQGG
jgi:hypothetical protein